MAKFWPLLGLLVLAGCASPAPIDVRVNCLPLRTWTPAEQLALANALKTIPPDSPIIALVLDWEKMREADRACLGQKPQ